MDKKRVKIPTIDMVGTGANIIKLREERGITVKDLQECLEFNTPQAIYKWQHGVSMPSLDSLLILSTVFGVPIDDILVKNYSYDLEIRMSA